jgi:hypothetical protein
VLHCKCELQTFAANVGLRLRERGKEREEKRRRKREGGKEKEEKREKKREGGKIGKKRER